MTTKVSTVDVRGDGLGRPIRGAEDDGGEDRRGQQQKRRVRPAPIPESFAAQSPSYDFSDVSNRYPKHNRYCPFYWCEKKVKILVRLNGSRERGQNDAH